MKCATETIRPRGNRCTSASLSIPREHLLSTLETTTLLLRSTSTTHKFSSSPAWNKPTSIIHHPACPTYPLTNEALLLLPWFISFGFYSFFGSKLETVALWHMPSVLGTNQKRQNHNCFLFGAEQTRSCCYACLMYLPSNTQDGPASGRSRRRKHQFFSPMLNKPESSSVSNFNLFSNSLTRDGSWLR